MSGDDELLFPEDGGDTAPSPSPSPSPSPAAGEEAATPLMPAPAAVPWQILVVDDDPQVLAMTDLLLRDFVFQGRRAELLHAGSAAEAKTLLAAHPDVAVILLDVVMESDDAGLALVHFVRREMGNRKVRIILRTGQPGHAPEREVVLHYDINDYRAKTELTAQKLFTSVVGALRAWQDIVSIERNRLGLEKILNASASLFDKRSMQEFVEGVILQLEGLIRSRDGSVLCCRGLGTGTAPPLRPAAFDADVVVMAGTRAFASLVGQPIRRCLPDSMVAEIESVLHSGENVFGADRCLLVFQTFGHGASVFYIRQPEPFSEDDRRLLEIFANRITSGFDNVCLLEDVTLLNESLERQVTERTRQARETAALLQATLDNMSEGLAAFDERGRLAVCNRRTLELLGIPEAERARLVHWTDVEKALTRGRVLRDGDWMEVEFPGGPTVQVRRRQLMDGGEVAVYLDVSDERRQQRKLAAEIERRKLLEQELRRLAATDPLTDSFTRRHFMELAEREVLRARRSGRAFSVLLFDIDHFKTINDSFGHAAGDRALEAFAATLHGLLRETDALGRLGGEEFAVLLPETELAGAFLVAERLRHAVAALALRHESADFGMTVSIGVAELVPEDNLDRLLARADKALYAAKQQGRNRSVSLA